MTTAGELPNIEIDHAKVFSRIWLIAAIVATIATPFVVLWKDSAPWLISVPISIGVIIVFTLEFRRQFQTRRIEEPAEKHFSVLPADYRGMGAFEESVVLELKSTKKAAKGQLDMFEEMNPEDFPQTKVRVFKDAKGREVYAINCSRFVELMVSRLMEDVDKAAEHALAMAWKRYRQGTANREELRRFLDKTIRETIKSDFRGNALIIFSKTGEKVIKELVATVEESLAPEASELPEAPPPKGGKRR